MNSTPEVVALTERIEQLERKNRTFQTLCHFSFAMSFLLSAFFICELFGFEVITHKAIYAESFVLKDAEGDLKGELSSSDDITKLAFYDDGINPRMAIALAKNDPGMHLYDHYGMRKAVFGLGAGQPCLKVFESPATPVDLVDYKPSLEEINRQKENALHEALSNPSGKVY